MACVDTLQLNDVGTSLEFSITECISGTETIVDITTVTSIDIRFDRNSDEYPDSSPILDVTGVIFTGGTNGNGTDGIVQYITQSGDVSLLGKWKVQVKLTFPTGIFSSNIDKTIKVLDNL